MKLSTFKSFSLSTLLLSSSIAMKEGEPNSSTNPFIKKPGAVQEGYPKSSRT